jgi:hypothetical protein
MPVLRTIPLCTFAILLAFECPAQAQVPDRFTNLKVLPTTISKEDLTEKMRGFCFSLGVSCEDCHVMRQDGSSSAMDFASDENKEKGTARTMMRMTQEINRNYIDGISTPPIAVECVTCHHGSAQPRTLQAVLSQEIDRNGVASAVTLYGKLRKENYGNGQYDFSETPLNLLSESLLKKKMAKESAAVMELNAEVNHPLSRWGYGCLALAHKANSEPEKAEHDLVKILEIDPQNTWAADELKSIRSARQVH